MRNVALKLTQQAWSTVELVGGITHERRAGKPLSGVGRQRAESPGTAVEEPAALVVVDVGAGETTDRSRHVDELKAQSDVRRNGTDVDELKA